MRKDQKLLNYKFPPVKLYFDDLEEIAEILENRGKNKLEISNGDYIFESIDEFKSHSRDEFFKNLKFQTSNPFLTVSIGRTNSISYFDDTNELRGISDRILQILKNRSRKLSKIYTPAIFVFVTLLVLIIHYVTLKLLPNEPVSYFFLFIFSIAGGSLGATLSLRNYNKLYLKRKREMKSFWRRKRDDILVAIISAIAGAVVGSIITLLISK